jgi:hypothetical protein
VARWNGASFLHHRMSVHRKEHPMMDVIMLALGLGFFALSVGYVLACDRL